MLIALGKQTEWRPHNGRLQFGEEEKPEYVEGEGTTEVCRDIPSVPTPAFRSPSSYPK